MFVFWLLFELVLAGLVGGLTVGGLVDFMGFVCCNWCG